MTVDPTNLNFTDQVARQVFRTLLNHREPLSARDLAGTIDSDERHILSAFAALKEAGRAEFDDEGRLIGVYGLTLKETEHNLVLRGAPFFVWCAFDSVGIPAALNESASVSSVCANCGRSLNFTIDGGRPPHLPLVISWLPKQCDSVRDEFCPTVSFYCDVDHLRASVKAAPADAHIDLETAATIGRDTWGWAGQTPDG